jgi:hypothetical protein
MKIKYSTILLFLIPFAVLLSFIIFLKMPYRQNAAKNIAYSFIKLLETNKINEAYELTVKGSYIGDTISDFRNNSDVVAIQIKNAPIIFYGLRPAQTYGNRLRRWIYNRNIDPDILYFEYSVGKIPVSIIMKKNNEKWNVYRVEIHAG